MIISFLDLLSSWNRRAGLLLARAEVLRKRIGLQLFRWRKELKG